MDVFSHGLWSGAIFKGINIKSQKHLRVKWAIFWGVFPDVFAFASLFVWLFGSMIFGNMSFSDWPRPDATEPIQPDTLFIFQFTSFLYSLTHSLAIFAVVFGLSFLIFRRPIWELLSWLIHILIDIPTHTYQFYPTPFLWPFSDVKFDGFSWGTPWFMFLNIFLVASVYLYLYLRNKKQPREVLNFDNILLAILIFILGSHYFKIIPFEVDEVLLMMISGIATLPVLWSAIKSLRDKKISVDLLASVALVFSLIAGEYASAVFINLMLTSARIFSSYVDALARHSIESLLKLKPHKAKIKRGDGVIEVAIDQIKKGDLIVIGLGEQIPVDGVVVDGQAGIDQSSMTGESVPISKMIGDSVLSSTIVVDGNLIVSAEKVGKETTFERIIELVEKSQANKAKINNIADRFATWYILSAFVVGVALYFIFGNISFVLAVLLVVCADDIAIAVPLAFLLAIGHSAQDGVIIKGNNFIEGFEKLKILVVDKTGTLTKGKLSVVDVFSFGRKNREEMMALSGIAFSVSTHPVARAIVKYVKEKGIIIEKPDKYEEHGGRGAVAYFRGHRIIVGNLPFFNKLKINIGKEQTDVIYNEERRGLNVTLAALGDELIGFFVLADELRPEIKKSIRELKNIGVEKVIMLTGDNERVAKRIAEDAGVDEYYANLLPEDKLAHLKKYLSKDYKVAMVGDGVNDAAVLAASDIGIAMGAIGSDVAIETADVVLMRDDFSKLPEVIKLAREVMRISRQNFIIWGVVNIIGLGLVFGGVILVTGAAAYNFLTDFIPLLNSSRLLGFREGHKK